MQLTICDPACGSGAFLNQALDFLIEEHKYIDDLKAQVLGGGLQFPDIENIILENNIYGVDLNEESVEIAKLSLWLRTAQPRRKLNDLSSNIKCGNSLIDSKAVAGDKAFVWEKEFPEIFKQQPKQIFHITTAIHYSRTSARMKKYKVREKREAGTNLYLNVIYFTPEDDLLITQAIADVVEEQSIDLLAYNICADNIHLLLHFELEAIPDIMRRIKGKSSYMSSLKGLKPLGNDNTDKKPLWSQKYSAPKEVTTKEQLDNTLNYIHNNRKKHELPPHSADLQAIIDNMCITLEEAQERNKGGFDVVIGNPPQGIFLSDNEEEYYKEKYPLTNYKINLYILFIERMFQIFNGGLIQFIIPKSLLFNTHFKNIREHLLTQSKVHEVFMISEKVFPDAEVGGSFIIKYEIVEKPSVKNEMKLISADQFFDYEAQMALVNNIKQDFFLSIPHFEISPIAEGADEIVKRLHNLKPIRTYYKLKNGLNPRNIKQVLISNKKLSVTHKPIIWGKELNPYSIHWGGQYVNYDFDIAETLSLEDIQSKKGMKKQTRTDFALRTPDLFETEKILVRKTGDRFIAAKDRDNLYFDTLIHGIYSESKEFTLDYLLAILNSNVATTFYRLLHDIKGKVFAKISLDKLGAFPLPNTIITDRKSLADLSLELQILKPQFDEMLIKFNDFLSAKFSLIKLSRKLENWHELSFADFIKELQKAIKKENRERKKAAGDGDYDEIPLLTKKGEFEWMELFESKKKEAQELQSQINTTEKEIDQMVYELYKLTDEEIAIVESA